MLKEYYKRPDATAEAIDARATSTPATRASSTPTATSRSSTAPRTSGKLANGAMFAPNYIENKLKFFSYIKEAVAFGDGRDEVCAFINIDMAAVGNWAERRNIAYSGYTDLARSERGVRPDPRMRGEGQRGTRARSRALPTRRCDRFLILHKELDPDDDELTRTRKVRRGFIAEKYAVLIDALYSDARASSSSRPRSSSRTGAPARSAPTSASGKRRSTSTWRGRPDVPQAATRRNSPTNDRAWRNVEQRVVPRRHRGDGGGLHRHDVRHRDRGRRVL